MYVFEGKSAVVMLLVVTFGMLVGGFFRSLFGEKENAK
jgi:hypothetical protein